MASQASVDAFRALAPDKQKDALGRMSPEAKSALLDGIKGTATEETSTGITVPKGMVGSDKDSVLGGGARRIGEILSGAYHTLADPPTEEEQKRGFTTDTAGQILQRPLLATRRVVGGVVEGEKQAAGQVQEQLKAAQDTKGDPTQKGLAYARAGVTAASMADPFATGPVTNVNKLSDEGRYKEALGAGTFDALTLLAGRSHPFSKDLSTEVSAETKLNKMAYATDAKGLGTSRPLEDIMPDLEKTIRQTVADPSKATIGEVETSLQKTMTGYDQQFNAGLAKTKGKFVPDQIADQLESKAKSMPPTKEGQAIAGQLRDAATEYRKPWTAQELNSERMYRNANTQGFHNKSGTAQMAAMRSNADTMVDEIVAREAREVLYDEMERQNPGGGFEELKSKQSSILEMQDHLKDHVRWLEASQRSFKGEPWTEKAGLSASVHPGGSVVTPRIHPTNLLSRGPLARANAAVRGALGPARGAARTSILALPVSSIALKRPPTVPAVPQDNGEDEGQQQ